MRGSPLVTVAAAALASCVAAGCTARPTPTPTPGPTATPTPTPTPSPTPTDLTIGINLQPDTSKKKCVVGFDLQEAKSAVAYTGYQVIWRVTKNACGDQKKGTLGKKALGLGFLKDRPNGKAAKWLDRCTTLPFVPGTFDTPPQIVCFIPWAKESDIEGRYDYAIDGDTVDPLDPDLDVRPGR
jgi:hypothetical protein